MTNNKKLHSILVALGMVFLLHMQGYAQVANQTTQTEGKKQLTRAQFVAMDEQQQRNFTRDFDQVVITDIVNSTNAEAQNPQEGVFYMTLDQYRNTDPAKQAHIAKNSQTYKVYDSQQKVKGVENGNVISKTLTMEEFKSLPQDKQKSILESKEFTIIE